MSTTTTTRAIQMSNSYGLRVMDIAWQAYLAGVGDSYSCDIEDLRVEFQRWWALRVGQSCALPKCEKCGHEAST